MSATQLEDARDTTNLLVMASGGVFALGLGVGYWGAILQGAPLVILDESFAALDPETLEQCLQCVLRRAPSLLVIAHP